MLLSLVTCEVDGDDALEVLRVVEVRRVNDDKEQERGNVGGQDDVQEPASQDNLNPDSLGAVLHLNRLHGHVVDEVNVEVFCALIK